jgi:hypothetical protein
MSNPTFVEKRKFEQLLGMNSGYVLDFTNRSFAEFVLDGTGRDIYDSRYDYGSGSKANRLRAFWEKEDNALVGKLMKALLDYKEGNGPLDEVCRLIVARLLKDGGPITAVETEVQGRQQAGSINRSPASGKGDASKMTISKSSHATSDPGHEAADSASTRSDIDGL